VRYPLRIVRFDADREKNPFGLAIDCFDDVAQPSRLDLVAEHRLNDAVPRATSPAGGAAGALQNALSN